MVVRLFICTLLLLIISLILFPTPATEGGTVVYATALLAVARQLRFADLVRLGVVRTRPTLSSWIRRARIPGGEVDRTKYQGVGLGCGRDLACE